MGRPEPYLAFADGRLASFLFFMPLALFLTCLGCGLWAINALGWIWGGAMAMPFALAALISGRASLRGLRLWLRRDPLVRVDTTGVHVWRYPPLSLQNVASVRVTPSQGQIFVVIVARDNAELTARMSKLRQIWERGNQALGDGDIFLSGQLLSDPDKVADGIRQAVAGFGS